MLICWVEEMSDANSIVKSYVTKAEAKNVLWLRIVRNIHPHTFAEVLCRLI